MWAVAGPVPFTLGLLFFWSDMSRSGEAALSAFGWAVVMAGLFAWLKITHAARSLRSDFKWYNFPRTL